MSDRLSSLDVSFLYLEEPTTAMHVGSVMLFSTPAEGLDVDRLVRHIGARIAFVPRYRQRVRAVPGRLANPVWVDDEHFDLNYHVRRAALPAPGGDAELAELVARLQSRRLDRRRPLWEATVVEGLSGDRFALVTKVHQAMVDGVNAVDLGQVILADDPDPAELPTDTWHPAAGAERRRAGRRGDRRLGPPPGPAGGPAAVRAERRPQHRRPHRRGARRSGGGGPDRDQPGPADPAQPGHLRAPPDRDDRHRPGGLPPGAQPGHPAGEGAQGQEGDRPPTAMTVNDVVLATLTGGLRSWLQTRGQPVPPSSTLRALVPMSVRVDDPNQAGAIGSRVASLLVDLPTGEASPLIRLHQVAYQTKAHRDTGQAVDAPAIAGIAGFAPPTLHSLGARLASSLSRRLFNLVVTNVPGPQQALYLDTAQMLASYPVIPLARGQALSVGLTSYDGGVYYGLNADRAAMPDLEVLGQCLVDALAELVEATS